MLKTAAAHQFTFDAVQMSLNVMDAQLRQLRKESPARAGEENIGVLGMKSMGDKTILKSNTATPVECLHYAMNLPTSVVITGCDSMKILQQALDAARISNDESDRSRESARQDRSRRGQGEYERYKTSHDSMGPIESAVAGLN